MAGNKFLPDIDPENNPEHRCLCGSKIVKVMKFMKDKEGVFRIYCRPCYEREIWNNDCTEDWIVD